MKYLGSVLFSIGLCAFGTTIGTASAVEQVGSAIKIKQNVTGFGTEGSRNLSVSDAVYRNEEISAASQSHGELELSDGSKIIVGENSVVLLDEFVVGDGGFKSGTIKVVKGAFRFVTGSSKKGAFTVKTPLATIGVRGTFFDIYVGGGKESVVLFRGEVQVCSTQGCQIARRSCDVIEISSSGVVQKAPFFGSSRANSSDRDYNLVENQGRFTRPLRAPRVLCNARAAMEATSPSGSEDYNGGETENNTPGRSMGNSSGQSPGYGSTGGQVSSGPSVNSPGNTDVNDAVRF